MYILEISSLSVDLPAVIFSHSEGILFTLLIVTFVVQKLLSLIRSHLFVCLFINFIFKLYIIVLVLPNIKMNPPQVYMRSPS